MSSAKPCCLVICSAAIDGVSTQPFIQAVTLLNSAFTLQLATPNGKAIEFVQQDDSGRRWLNDFRSKSVATPTRLDTIDVSRYACVLIPPAPGALYDLAKDADVATILNQAVAERKPVCAVGLGVAGLCGAMKDDRLTWTFSSYSLTGPSVLSLAKSPSFANLPLIIEDFIKDNGAVYSASKADHVHVVVDQNLITGQNEESTVVAVQNLILLCNARQGKQNLPS
ncbi:glutamine amidotransferase-like class 1 domain-containing protein 1 isoform X1 [Branchiostoma floridae]|uniref:Glutamine amidotransferase-like class 1 domain-containing protein 1 n=1 Tax=Branchiostoma floridae TaxID=7739 RepID=A0A9J7KR20_BRAFL|nr:glutamine amidotransferase-like class 1 domain-containing protein 1 isoform X1 [Branchiostoma floridae]